MAKRVVLDEGKDLVQASANHYYEGGDARRGGEILRGEEKENALLSLGIKFYVGT